MERLFLVPVSLLLAGFLLVVVCVVCALLCPVQKNSSPSRERKLRRAAWRR